MSDSQCKSKSDVLDWNIFYLKYYTWIEYYVAALLIMSATVFRPIYIVALPLLAVWCAVIFSNAVPRKVKTEVRKLLPGFGALFVRQTKSHDMSMIRIPFLRILFVPVSEFPHISSPSTRARLLHEYGHTKQYDVVVLIWLVVAATIWGRATQTTLPALLIGDLPQYEGRQDSATLYRTGMYWLLSFFIVALAAVLALISILHRREYLADAIGERQEFGSLSALLSSRIKLKPFMKKNGFWVTIWNKLTHPDDQKRLKILTEPMRVTAYGLAAAHFASAFLAAHVIFLFLVAIPEGGSGVFGTELSLKALLLISIGLPCVFLYHLTNTEYARAKFILAAVLGQLCGYTTSAILLVLLEHFAAVRDDFAMLTATVQYSISMCAALSISVLLGAMRFKRIRTHRAVMGLASGIIGLLWFGVVWWLIQLPLTQDAFFFGRDLEKLIRALVISVLCTVAMFGGLLLLAFIGDFIAKRLQKAFWSIED